MTDTGAVIERLLATDELFAKVARRLEACKAAMTQADEEDAAYMLASAVEAWWDHHRQPDPAPPGGPAGETATAAAAGGGTARGDVEPMADSAPGPSVEEAKTLLEKRWDIRQIIQQTHPVDDLLELTLRDVEESKAAVKAAEAASADARDR